MMPADPVKAMIFIIWILIIFIYEVLVVFMYPPAESVLLVVVLVYFSLAYGILVWEFPFLRARSGIVAMMHHSTSLQHQYFISLETELHSCVAAAYS